jgi:hypothetical protein
MSSDHSLITSPITDGACQSWFGYSAAKPEMGCASQQ